MILIAPVMTPAAPAPAMARPVMNIIDERADAESTDPTAIVSFKWSSSGEAYQ
jgi:hypothetical protein